MNLCHTCRFVYGKVVRKRAPLLCFSPACPRSPLFGHTTELQVAISFFHFFLYFVVFICPGQSSGDMLPSLLPQERLTDTLQDLHCILVAATDTPCGNYSSLLREKDRGRRGWESLQWILLCALSLGADEDIPCYSTANSNRTTDPKYTGSGDRKQQCLEQPTTSSLPSPLLGYQVYVASTQGQICTSYLL